MAVGVRDVLTCRIVVCVCVCVCVCGQGSAQQSKEVTAQLQQAVAFLKEGIKVWKYPRNHKKPEQRVVWLDVAQHGERVAVCTSAVHPFRSSHRAHCVCAWSCLHASGTAQQRRSASRSRT
mgnify:CR=1 FL=1